MPTQASPPLPNRSLELSQKLYQRLLRAYPRSHREKYGGAMAQLFRDQCRDAWAEGRTRGLAALWLHTLPDLVKTSFLERWSNFNLGKFMTDTLNALRPRRSPTAVFFAVFIMVFLITLVLATAVTFILPETYASTARVKVELDPDDANPANAQVFDYFFMQDVFANFIQNTFATIQSKFVLSNVVNSLNLNKEWGRKYYAGEIIETTNTIELLKRRLELKPVKNTKLISITAYSDDKKEAAKLANAVGEAYQKYRKNQFAGTLSTRIALSENQYAQQDSLIGQLRSETEALAKKFGVVAELPADVMKQSQSQAIDDEKACQALKTRLQRLQAMNSDGLRNTLPTITGDASLTELLGKLDDGKQQIATLRQDYGPADMHIVRTVATINEVNSEIDARVSGIMAALQSEVDSKRAAMEAVQASINSTMHNSKPTVENQPYWDKKGELDQLLNLHNTLAAKIDEEKLAQLSPANLVEFTDFAQPGEVPVKPNKPRDIFFGAICGVILGAVIGCPAAYIAGRSGRRKAAPGTV